MAAPTVEIVQKRIQNPHASAPLIIPIAVLCNTSTDDLGRNVRINAARDLPWLQAAEPHGVKAVMVGGGPSAAEHLPDIRALRSAGGVIFAMNAASQWLRSHGISPDYQVICDAKEETATLVDPAAPAHLFASQVNPATMEAIDAPTVWHLEIGEVERFFPEQKVKRGGYVLLGGGAAVGNSAMCVAYAMGFRDFHVFGYDSSHRGEQSHAYPQPMNALIPTIEVEWAGRRFTSSVAMKAQAEKFQITGQALQQEGCAITLYGDGLLQHMYRTPPSNLTERDKYRTLWQFDGYREVSPGEGLVPILMQRAPRPGPVIDFGCGTGRASLRLAEAGYEVVLVDFADNCRDDEALALPFLEWDLTQPCPLRAPWGICSDVMEHIPTDDVPKAVASIMGSARRVLFQISTVPDTKGKFICHALHLTVMPHRWWLSLFKNMGYRITMDRDDGIASIIMVENREST